MKPAEHFHERFTKAHFVALYQEFIEDGSAVGRDGMRPAAFGANLDAEIDIILRKVKARTYKFTPYREKLISKGADKKPRQISIPTVRDKLVLKFASELLATIFPDHVSQPPHKFVKQIHQSSKSRPGSDFYLRLDIESYFPSIDHKILMRVLRRTIRQKNLLYVIEQALKTPTGKKPSESEPITKGVPQGLSISNILSSLYLSEIDKKFSALSGVEYCRFVDDILVIADHPTTLKLANDIPVAMKSLRKIHCHTVGAGSKSTIVSLSEGIDYLGYNFRQSSVQVRKSSFKRMFTNLMKLFSAMKYKKNKGPLIWRMNLRISGCLYLEKRVGWLFFFSQSNNKQQLKQLDAFVAAQARKVLEPEDCARLKTFTRGYHEIRYNYEKSRYFPNFDNFQEADKKAQIGLLLPNYDLDRLEGMSPEDLDKLFRKCISKEISDLEKDMMEVFS